MKTRLLSLFLVVSIALFAQSTGDAEVAPEACFGTYAGNMKEYTMLSENGEILVAAHDIKLIITRKFVKYYSGTLELKGTYEVFKQDKKNYLITAHLTNGSNFNYDIECVWNKKTKTILLTGQNGEPDVELAKID